MRRAPPPDLFGALPRLMAMDERVWARHANPLSVYTRIPILPLLAFALYARVWIGWWSLLPAGALILWAWANPRVFPPPASLDNWASRGVLGERIYLARRERAPPAHHLRAARLTTLLSLAGLPFLVWGLIRLEPWPTAFGAAIATLGKLWFFDRMVWLHDETTGAA